MHVFVLLLWQKEKVFAEVTDVLDRFEGRIDYETIGEMKYLEACIFEDLRMFGPVLVTRRLCGKDCEVSCGQYVC